MRRQELVNRFAPQFATHSVIDNLEKRPRLRKRNARVSQDFNEQRRIQTVTLLHGTNLEDRFHEFQALHHMVLLPDIQISAPKRHLAKFIK